MDGDVRIYVIFSLLQLRQLLRPKKVAYFIPTVHL